MGSKALNSSTPSKMAAFPIRQEIPYLPDFGRASAAGSVIKLRGMFGAVGGSICAKDALAASHMLPNRGFGKHWNLDMHLSI
jgi:hypothetical protein